MSKSNTQRLPFLYQAARALSGTLDTDQVLQRLMTLTHQHFEPDAVSVALVEPDDSLVFRAASGKSAQQVLGLRMAPGTGIVGWVAEHGETLWVPNTRVDDRHYPGVDQATGFTTQAIYAVPVKLATKTVAVLELINPRSGTNMGELQEVMTSLAALAAPAIQNARLFEQVRETEDRYQRLFELNLDPIIIMDKEGNLLHVNQAGQQLLDILPGVEGQTWLEKLGLPREAPTKYTPSMLGGNTTTWELAFTTDMGNERTFEISLAYLAKYPPEGAYQILAHDITDRVALQRMRELLSNMIVHDLRNPLNSITYSMELLRSAWREQDTALPVEQIIKIGIRSAQRMDMLISDILDAARLPQNPTIVATCIQVPVLVHEAMEMVHPSALRRHQNLKSDLDPDLPELEADIDLLRRVLVNIISNAIKFTPREGTITVGVTTNNTEFVFSVTDSGPGIPPSEQAHIFDPFYQGKAGKGKKGSTGLGLAFCKLAVEAHRGRIWIESDEGEGATFFFTVPRSLPPEAELEEACD